MIKDDCEYEKLKSDLLKLSPEEYKEAFKDEIDKITEDSKAKKDKVINKFEAMLEAHKELSVNFDRCVLNDVVMEKHILKVCKEKNYIVEIKDQAATRITYMIKKEV